MSLRNVRSERAFATCNPQIRQAPLTTVHVPVDTLIASGAGRRLQCQRLGRQLPHRQDGDALGTPTNLPLFNLGPAANGSIPLLISHDLAGALTSMFELADEIDLTGAGFGLASTSPSVQPLPAGLPLLLAGVGGLALLLRKRAA